MRFEISPLGILALRVWLEEREEQTMKPMTPEEAAAFLAEPLPGEEQTMKPMTPEEAAAFLAEPLPGFETTMAMTRDEWHHYVRKTLEAMAIQAIQRQQEAQK